MIIMYGSEIIKYLEEWAPPEVAWKNDNVGLQVGSKDVKIKNIKDMFEISEVEFEACLKKEGTEKETIVDLVIERMALLVTKS